MARKKTATKKKSTAAPRKKTSKKKEPVTKMSAELAKAEERHSEGKAILAGFLLAGAAVALLAVIIANT